MATLGRWTGGVQSQGNPPESWTAPNGLFPTQSRNDSSAYSWASTTSTVTLPSSSLADGYLLVGRYEYEDTSNGRLTPQGRFIQSSGTGTFVAPPSGGYNRDNSEDRSYVSCWGFVDGPSASAQFQFQWKADTDDSTGGTVRSSFDVIPLYYADAGIYSSTSSSLYGGTSPNQVTGWTGTDGTNITLSSDVVTVTGDNKRYFILGGQFYEGRGGRTQRWMGLRVDGTKEDAAKAYAYYRNTANDETGGSYHHLIETATASITIDSFCYRGDGVSAGQGGANVDGNTPSVGSHGLVVLELNDSAEVYQSTDSVGGVDLNLTGPLDQPIARAGDININDSASWDRQSDSAVDVQSDMDGLIGANLSAAQEVVSVTSRWTAQARITVNGTEDDDVFHGNYARNNQGSTDTFGWSANPIGFVALQDTDTVGSSIQELTGGEDGGQYEIQPGWGGFWALNLDTLESSGGENYTETNTFSGSGANTLSHTTARLRSYTFGGAGALAVSFLVGAARAFGSSAVGTASLSRLLGTARSFSFSGAGASVASWVVDRSKALASSAVGVVALSMTLGKGVVVALSGAGSSALSKALGLSKSLAMGGTASVVFSYSIALVQSLSHAGAAIVSRAQRLSAFRVFAAAGTAVAGLSRKFGTAKTFSGLASVALTAIKDSAANFQGVMTAAGSVVAQMRLSAVRALSVAASGAASLAIKTGNAISPSLSGIGGVALSRLASRLKTMTATVAGSVTSALLVGRETVVSLSGSGVASLLHLVGRSRAFSAAAVGSLAFSYAMLMSSNASFTASGTSVLNTVYTPRPTTRVVIIG